MDERVVVIGAGPSGLAIAWELRRRGFDPLILERGASVATSWRSRHDHLRLNSHRVFSYQPGQRLLRQVGPFPSRDAYVTYLEGYAAGMRVQPNTNVVRLDQETSGWRVQTPDGDIVARHAVVATGPDREPVIPHWPGQDTFPGVVIHAGQFRNVADLRGCDVLVVGPGNSGIDLLNHLVRGHPGRLWLSARSGMNIAPLRLLGLPTPLLAPLGRYQPVRVQDLSVRFVQRLAFGDLSRYGYPRSRLGALSRFRYDEVGLALDDGFVKALKAGRVVMKPEINCFQGATVCFTDGSCCEPDVVICATGYRTGLEPLVGHVVALGHKGMPPLVDHSSAQHPGLWFFGLNNSPYGNLHVHRREARRLARIITKDLTRHQTSAQRGALWQVERPPAR